jgi:hypothetical protein
VALLIGPFVWGDKYGADYVDKLRRGLERNLTGHEFRVFEAEDADLTQIPGCFARLRAFDPEWQARQGLKEGDRLVILDLDLIVTGSLEGLFEREDPFTILQGVNASNPCPYNGSLWMLRAGYRPDVWSDFSLDAAKAVPYDSFPDDQAWFAAKLPDAGKFGHEDGVYAFQKKMWPRGNALPKNARIVAFPGWRDPAGFTHLPWVYEHWRA